MKKTTKTKPIPGLSKEQRAAVDAVRTLRVERWIESSYGCVIAMTDGGATNMVSRVVNDVTVDERRSERRGMDVLSRQHR